MRTTNARRNGDYSIPARKHALPVGQISNLPTGRSPVRGWTCASASGRPPYGGQIGKSAPLQNWHFMQPLLRRLECCLLFHGLGCLALSLKDFDEREPRGAEAGLDAQCAAQAPFGLDPLASCRVG